jgi:hypothetical protein
MAKFYFHVASTDEFVPDYEGSELQGLAECHNHALKIIWECLPFVQSDQRRWWIEIADGYGKDVLTVLYRATLRLDDAATPRGGEHSGQTC